jgi:polysaccharide export outer membrane protein
VVISKAGIVYVVGDVRVPTGVVLENPKLTVLKALAMAQGANPTAAQDKTRIIRHTPDGGEEEIPVPLKKILAAKVPDPPLFADDILFVPNSAAKSALRRGSEALVQTAVGAAIYAPLY